MSVGLQSGRLIIGTVYGLEDDIVKAADDFAIEFGLQVSRDQKPGLDGPNEILYLLADAEFWRSLASWAGVSIATGAMRALGTMLFNRYFANDVASKLAEISAKQTAYDKVISEHFEEVGEKFDTLVNAISSKERYRSAGSEVRIGIPTAPGMRTDVGVRVNPDRTDIVCGIIVLAAASAAIEAFRGGSQR